MWLLELSICATLALGQTGGSRRDDAFSLNGQMELARLVDLAAKQSGVPVEYDASVIKGVVTLRIERALSDAELWALVNKLLASRGFTTVLSPGSEVVSVVKLADAAGVSRVSVTPAGGEAKGSNHGLKASGVLEVGDAIPSSRVGFQTVVVRLRHRSPRDVIEPVGRLLSKPGGQAVALTDESGRDGARPVTATNGTAGGGATFPSLPASAGGLLMISDLVPRLEQAMGLLQTIDAPAIGAVIVSVPVASVAPEALATLVMQLAQKREQVLGSAGAGGGGSGARVNGEVIASTTEQAVLIVSPPERVEFWKSLIAQLDRQERRETVSYSSLNYGAKELAAIIERTLPSFAEARAIDEPLALRDGGQGPLTQPSARSNAHSAITIDDRTGTLLIAATPTEHEAIRSLIERLDSSPGARRTQVRSFPIRNRSVADLVPILQQLMRAELGDDAFNADGSDITSPRRPGEMRAPLPPVTADDARRRDPTNAWRSPNATDAWSSRDAAYSGLGERGGRDDRGGPGDPSRLAPPITFTADNATNTLLAMGEPRLLEQLESLIKQLDVRQPQVMLEVLLVSLTDSQTLDLGLELEKLDLDGDIQWRLSSLFGLSSRSGAGQVTAGGAGGTAVVLRPGDFSVVLRALQTLNKGRSLSMPMVLVTNNEQATLDSTLEQPFASTTSPSNSNSTTSFGGSLPAGTQISIKPQIADADQLTLDYQLSLSSFSGAAASPNLPPPRQQNRVQSIATIPDGHVVVVGGIELQTDGKASSQVPLLGDLPVIGEAFKTRSKNTSKQRFYVFIRANVLRERGFEDLKYMSEVRTQETGVDDGWPKVEPGWIR